MIDQITELLMMEFCSVYCSSCAYKDKADDGCYMCYNWELSKKMANRIAENIDELYKKYYRKNNYGQ